MMRTHPPTNNKRQGVVLIVVLVLVIMIALAGFSFVRSMSTDYEAAKVGGDAMQAEQALLSAEVYINRYLQMPRLERESASTGTDTVPVEFRAIRLLSGTEEAGGSVAEPTQPAEDGWQFSIVAPATLTSGNDDGIEASQPYRFGLADQSNKLNLAAIAAWDRIRPGAGRATLMKLPGMTTQIADALLDWIDVDSERREFGAEADFYAELSQPYRVANRLPGSLEALLLVRGVTRNLLFGADENRNFRIDDDEQQLADARLVQDSSNTAAISETTAWCDLLTVHSAERNDSPGGTPRINLNNPDLAILQSELSAVFPTEVTNFVLLYRQYGPSNPTTSVSAAGVTVNTTTPARTNVAALSDLVDAKVTVPGEPAFGVSSPFTRGSAELGQWLGPLLSQTTTNPQRVLAARLNINSAPEAVVRAIPFLSDEIVESLLDARRNLEPTERRSVAWLLTKDIISVETFRQLQPWLTAGGDVFACQLIVFRGSRGPIRRVRAVFDGASPSPRRLEWQSLQGLGNGFSRSEVSREIADLESALTESREP